MPAAILPHRKEKTHCNTVASNFIQDSLGGYGTWGAACCRIRLACDPCQNPGTQESDHMRQSQQEHVKCKAQKSDHMRRSTPEQTRSHKKPNTPDAQDNATCKPKQTSWEDDELEQTRTQDKDSDRIAHSKSEQTRAHGTGVPGIPTKSQQKPYMYLQTRP